MGASRAGRGGAAPPGLPGDRRALGAERGRGGRRKWGRGSGGRTRSQLAPRPEAAPASATTGTSKAVKKLPARILPPSAQSGFSAPPSPPTPVRWSPLAQMHLLRPRPAQTRGGHPRRLCPRTLHALRLLGSAHATTTRPNPASGTLGHTCHTYTRALLQRTHDGKERVGTRRRCQGTDPVPPSRAGARRRRTPALGLARLPLIPGSGTRQSRRPTYEYTGRGGRRAARAGQGWRGGPLCRAPRRRQGASTSTVLRGALHCWPGGLEGPGGNRERRNVCPLFAASPGSDQC